MTKNLFGWAPVAVAAGLGALAVAGNAMLSKRSRSRSEEDGPETMRDGVSPAQVVAMDRAFARFIEQKDYERQDELHAHARALGEEIETVGQSIDKLRTEVGELAHSADRGTHLSYVIDGLGQYVDRFMNVERMSPEDAKMRAYAVAMTSLLTPGEAVEFAYMAGTTPSKFAGRYYSHLTGRFAT
jgi:hypothetical protein